MVGIINFLNTIFWGYVLIYGLLAVGIYFTLRLRFIQIVHFGEMLRGLRRSSGDNDGGGISPFQALSISLASRVGTGNITGVAVAITVGGPGAVFWMWMVAALGMATAFAESTLAQLYKEHDARGMLRGGPAFYIKKGLGQGWLAVIFSIALIIAFGLVFNALQANSIAEAVQGAFGINKAVTGIGVAVLAGLIIFGGIPQIARAAQVIVPFMAGAYLLVALWAMILHINLVPGAFMMIIKSAFGFEQAAGGVIGGMMAAMMNGVKRGLFSNEAGMGSAPNIAAVAVPDPHHPASQGFVQALGVFIDTILVCSATAIMILLSGAIPSETLTGVALTQAALSDHIGGFGAYFIAIALFFFAFTSIIGNYAYAENAVAFLGHDRMGAIIALRVAVLGMVIWGALQTVQTVFDFADASMGLMATINLIAIVLLSGTVTYVARDYIQQRKEGKMPIFRAADHPEIAPGISHKIWK